MSGNALSPTCSTVHINDTIMCACTRQCRVLVTRQPAQARRVCQCLSSTFGKSKLDLQRRVRGLHLVDNGRLHALAHLRAVAWHRHERVRRLLRVLVLVAPARGAAAVSKSCLTRSARYHGLRISARACRAGARVLREERQRCEAAAAAELLRTPRMQAALECRCARAAVGCHVRQGWVR